MSLLKTPGGECGVPTLLHCSHQPLLSPALALAVLLACLLVSPRPHNLKEMLLDLDGKL